MQLVTANGDVVTILTDPAIVTKKREYFKGTQTNLRNGFKLFPDAHKQDHGAACEAATSSAAVYL